MIKQFETNIMCSSDAAAGLLLFAFLFAIAPARAEALAPTPAETPGPAAAAPRPMETPPPDTRNLIDSTHDFLSSSFNRPLAWLDHFFMSRREEYEINQSFFRLIGNYTWVNKEGFHFKPQLRMKFRLKALQRRLSLIAFGQPDEETVPNSPVEKVTQLNPAGPVNTDTNRVGFRYAVLDWFDSRFDADVVFSSKLIPEPYLRARQRLYHSDRTLSRFTVTGFWEKDLRFGQTTQLDYAHAFRKRWAYDVTVRGRQSQVVPALAWENAINTSCVLSPREAMSLHLQAVGPTRPHAIVQNYHASVVYRRNFYRAWIFGEVEPGVDWPYLDDHRAPVWSTVFRLELQFKTQ